jgi:hypothetical protein
LILFCQLTGSPDSSPNIRCYFEIGNKELRGQQA